MSTTITLPASLRTRIAAIRRRARLLRAVRGLGLLVISLALSGAAAILADYGLDLSPLIRQVLFSVWLGLGAGLLLLGVVVPLCRRIDATALAALIEQKYPDLGERLTSAVELAHAPAEGHGSPVLIALLMDETEKQTTRIDFRPAMPARRAGVLAGLAAITVLLAATPAFVWPQQYADLTQRFFRPWTVAPAVAPYALEVTPGDAIAGRGRSVTLSAHLTPRDESITLPASSTLVVIDAAGKETRQAMERDGSHDFTIVYKVSGDVTYRIEAGEAVSDVYQVTAITPVELAAESPAITVTPPAYARAAKDEETFHGLVDLSPLQHSTLRFDFRFTRPAVAAYLEWLPASGGATASRENTLGALTQPRSPEIVRHPLILGEDRQTASFTMPALAEGKYRVVLEAEHGIRTELAGGTIGVRPDQPPSVLKFHGNESLRTVLPYERIPLEIETADDIAVAGVELEYRINDEEAVRQPLALEGGDTPSAVARHLWELAGKAQEGDRIHYRFRVRDNLPKEYKGPHVIVYPADRWLTLQVVRRGDPLKQQEILAQRDEINRKLESIKAALVKEKGGVQKVRQATPEQAVLPSDQAEQVKQLQQDNRGSQKALRDVAQTADATPELHSIAELARKVADQEMHQSQQALDQAPRQTSPRERTRRFDKADEQLASAVKRLDELKKANDRLAQERIDQARLEMLADREKHLAEQAAELAAKHPVLDPTVKPQAEKIQREQAEVAAELERLAEQSEPIRQARDQARAEATRGLAERAKELAQAQRDLARTEAETERQRTRDRLADLARRQQELAEQEARLAKQTRQPARTAQTAPLKPEETQRAADALKQGDAQTAVKHQDQAIRDLERLAQAFDRSIEQRRQKAQREIARLRQQQEEIARLVEQTRKDDPATPQKLAEAARRQAEVAEALSKMDAPHEEARQERTAEALQRALADLMDGRREDAPASQQEAKRQLERLEQALRGQKPADEQARDLARQQRELAEEAGRAAADPKATPQQKQELQRKQQQVAEQTRSLQAPEAPQRQREAAEATRQAAQAAQAQQTAPETQQRMREAARKLDELARQMAGQESDTARAERLARQQAEVAAQSERQAGRSTTPEMQRRQQEVAREAQDIRGGEEARQEKQRAMEALARAQQAPAKEQPQAQRKAADALRDLADRLAGRNDAAARANELARQQRELAREAAQTDPGKATPEQAKQAAQRQAELARQLARIDSKDAAGAAKEAGEKMAAAAKALEQARSLAEAKGAVARAAEATEKLADQLGKTQAAKKPGIASGETASAKTASPREMARQLAQQQRALEKAAAKAGQANKEATQQLAQQQHELGQQTSQLPASKAQRGLEQARAAMNRAEQALARNDAGQARQHQAEAANALDRLAKQLPAELPQAARRDLPDATAPAMPSKEQTEQARQLARQQRELRDAVLHAGEAARAERTAVQDNPVGELARQQAEVARQAGELARNVGQEQGEQSLSAQRARQAGEVAKQASRQMRAGALPQAQEAGKQTAEQLRQLAAQLARTPRGAPPETPDALQQARQLSQRQEEINRRMQPLAGDARASAAQQQAEQRDLQQQAGELRQQLQRLAQQMRKAPQAQASLQRASGASQQAEQAMQQARSQAQQGQAVPERQSQERAAQALEQAAREAGQAASQAEQASARAGAPKPGAEAGSPKTGQAVTQAQQQMSQAQGQLGRGQNSQARTAMRQAAQSLAQAAEQMASSKQPAGKPGQPGQPVGLGRLAGGLPDLGALGLDKTPHAGKSWGELPGELRTKIIQDMKGRYGDDYARMIKLYFEQIADTKTK
jgi:hypothetical protein